MKSFAISAISAISVLASFVVASPIVAPRQLPDVFKLKPGANAPPEIAGLGYLQWPGTTLNGNVGWTTGAAVEVTSFIQYNNKSGIAFYSRNTSVQIYLRPTHGTPWYFAKMGNPQQDSAPPLTLTDNFTLTTVDGVEYFGYGGSTTNWLACGSGGEYTLYHNPGPVSLSGCTALFSLETEHIPYP